MDDANMVQPGEQAESRRFLANMRAALTARGQQAYVPAEVTCLKQGWGDLQDGCSCNGEPLVLGGRSFTTGLGTHACSEIIVRLPAGAKRLTGWCGIAPMLFATLDIRRDDYDFARAAKMIGVWRRVADLMLQGDYYPLTPYHRSPTQWVAQQFDRPEHGCGFIQGIRLPAASAETLSVYPEGLQIEATYRIENPETGETRQLTCVALQQQGFCFSLPKRAGAIWLYQRIEE